MALLLSSSTTNAGLRRQEQTMPIGAVTSSQELNSKEVRLPDDTVLVSGGGVRMRKATSTLPGAQTSACLQHWRVPFTRLLTTRHCQSIGRRLCKEQIQSKCFWRHWLQTQSARFERSSVSLFVGEIIKNKQTNFSDAVKCYGQVWTLSYRALRL